MAIAGVMAMNPKVLILDEPASGLDPKGREQILGLIREYHEQMKKYCFAGIPFYGRYRKERYKDTRHERIEAFLL